MLLSTPKLLSSQTPIVNFHYQSNSWILETECAQTLSPIRILTLNSPSYSHQQTHRRPNPCGLPPFSVSYAVLISFVVFMAQGIQRLNLYGLRHKSPTIEGAGYVEGDGSNGQLDHGPCALSHIFLPLDKRGSIIPRNRNTKAQERKYRERIFFSFFKVSNACILHS